MGLLVTPQPIEFNMRRKATQALSRYNRVMRLPDICSRAGQKPDRPVRWFHPFAAAILFCQRMGCWCKFQFADLEGYRLPNFKKGFRDSGLSFTDKFKVFIQDGKMLVQEIERFDASFELVPQVFEIKGRAETGPKQVPAGLTWKPKHSEVWYALTDLGKEVAARVWLDPWSDKD